MSQENFEILVLAVIAVAAIASFALIQLRRQRLLTLAMRERERVLRSLAQRFADVDEFVAFANSADAQRLFQSLDSATAVGRRLLAMTALAIVAGFAGIAFLLDSLGVAPGDDINFINAARSARWWGILLLAVGVGLGAAVAVCARLARKWDLLRQ
jgi:hypothetical protein